MFRPCNRWQSRPDQPTRRHLFVYEMAGDHKRRVGRSCAAKGQIGQSQIVKITQKAFADYSSRVGTETYVGNGVVRRSPINRVTGKQW